MATLIFGDSFVGPFKLIRDRRVRVYKFKGATMKGLTKADNENRRTIQSAMSKTRNIKCAVFNFGQVDLYFSYYYKKFVKGERFMMADMVKRYVKFISELDCRNCHKIVFGVYPSTIQDQHVFGCLLNYGIMQKDAIRRISESEKKRVSKHAFRHTLYKKMNGLLQKECAIRHIEYIGFDDALLGDDRRLKKEFVNPVSLSIHLLWEPLLPILLKKLKCCKIKHKFKVNLASSLQDFIRRKEKEIHEATKHPKEEP
jgi:hypothetical protein